MTWASLSSSSVTLVLRGKRVRAERDMLLLLLRLRAGLPKLRLTPRVPAGARV